MASPICQVLLEMDLIPAGIKRPAFPFFLMPGARPHVVSTLEASRGIFASIFGRHIVYRGREWASSCLEMASVPCLRSRWEMVRLAYRGACLDDIAAPVGKLRVLGPIGEPTVLVDVMAPPKRREPMKRMADDDNLLCALEDLAGGRQGAIEGPDRKRRGTVGPKKPSASGPLEPSGDVPAELLGDGLVEPVGDDAGDGGADDGGDVGGGYDVNFDMLIAICDEDEKAAEEEIIPLLLQAELEAQQSKHTNAPKKTGTAPLPPEPTPAAGSAASSSSSGLYIKIAYS
jgi:hypothetical protein